MKKLLLLAMALLTSSPAFAYIIGTMGKGGTDPNVRTHIFIVGNGSDLGHDLGWVASAKAKKYVEQFPNEQVFLISVNETDKDEVDVPKLQEQGFQNIEVKGHSLDSKDVFKQMSKFNQIATLDVVSHTVAYYGVVLDGKFNRLDPKRDGYEKLRNRFTSDAYVFLHGCNSGWLLAPVLSKQWNIPVAGAYTGTDFQYVSSDNQFWNSDSRRPEGITKAKVNNLSYEKNIGCWQGACMRLYPDNNGYSGWWGNFRDGGLGFYKWSCNASIPQDKCFKTMAKAALSYVSVKALRDNSSLEDYKAVVQDYLCPQNRREACKAALEDSLITGDMTYDPYQAKTLQCDFQGCKAKFSCERVPLIDLLKQGSCVVENLRESNKTTTLVTEYHAYIKGFNILMRDLAAARR